MGSEAGILAYGLGFWPGGWILGLKALGGVKKKKEKKEKFPALNHRSLAPLGPPKKGWTGVADSNVHNSIKWSALPMPCLSGL